MLLLVTGIRAQTGDGTVADITPQELSALLGQVQVIDVNEPETYAEAHVPGAKLLAYDAIAAEALPADRSTKLVFYCWSPECPAAEQAATAASKLGFTNVACMHAGITGWQDAGLPTEP
jgi:rhodanese-related sulfurtransferase